MKILLINPKSSNYGFSMNPTSLFPPLGLGILASITPDQHEVKLIDENFDEFKYEDADLVALTSFSSTAPRAYEISKKYKSRGIPTVIGGTHASVFPDEALDHCNAVAIGEAENIWEDILKDALNGKLKGYYSAKPGIIKSPDRSIFNKRYRCKTIQTTRGCPLDCEYCSVSGVSGKRYRSREVNDVISDLEEIDSDFFIVDDNFIGYGESRRKRVIEILNHLIENNKKIWFCQTSINIAEDEELLTLLFSAGCRMLFIGVETEDGSSLIRSNKKRKSKCIDSMNAIHKHGISVLGSFIIGLEDDTEYSILSRIEFIKESGVDAYQISIMTPLPGTRLYDRAIKEGRLIYTDFPSDWSKYDFTNIVYVPSNFKSSEHLGVVIKKALDKVYNEEYIRKLSRLTIERTGRIDSAFLSYQSNLNYLNVYNNIIKEQI